MKNYKLNLKQHSSKKICNTLVLSSLFDFNKKRATKLNTIKADPFKDYVKTVKASFVYCI